MTDQTNQREDDRLSVADIAAVVVLLLGALIWVLVVPLILLVMEEWVRYPRVGDAAIGLIIFGPAIVAVSLVFLLVSVPLSLKARRLPRWARVLMVASPCLGLLVGGAITYRALGG